METIKILDAMKRCVDRSVAACDECPYVNYYGGCSTLKKDMNADDNIPRYIIKWFNDIEDESDPDTLYTEDEATSFYSACDNLIDELTPKAVDHDWDTDLSVTKEEEEEDDMSEGCDTRQAMVDRIKELEKTLEICEDVWKETYEEYEQHKADLEKELTQGAKDIEHVRMLHSTLVTTMREELDDAKTELVAYDERHMPEEKGHDAQPGLVEFLKGFSKYLEENPRYLSKAEIEAVKHIKNTSDIMKWLLL